MFLRTENVKAFAIWRFNPLAIDIRLVLEEILVFELREHNVSAEGCHQRARVTMAGQTSNGSDMLTLLMLSKEMLAVVQGCTGGIGRSGAGGLSREFG